MRKMGGEKIQTMAALLLPKEELESLALTQSQFTNAIIRAQKQLEGWHFSTRKHLFDYDSVINKQRQSIYTRRDEILQTLHHIYHPNETNTETQQEYTDKLTTDIINLIEKSIEQFLTNQQALGIQGQELLDLINKEYNLNLTMDHMTDSLYSATAQHITQHITTKLADGRTLLGDDIFIRICANIYLTMIDRNWVAHIDEMQYLREKV